MTARIEQGQLNRSHTAEFFRRTKTDTSFLEAFNKGVPIPILLGLPVAKELLALPPYRKPMEDILKDLSLASFDHTRSYFEYQIDGRVEQAHLARLPHFPYEVSIAEVDGELVLRTEDSRAVRNDGEMTRRRKYARLFLHSHPINPERRIQANTPSFPDLRAAAHLNSTNIIACEEGLLIYGSPNRHPLTGEEYSGDARDLIGQYCRSRGISYHDIIPDPRFRDIDFLTEEEKLLLQQQFANASGAIRIRAPWYNRAATAAIVEVINQIGQEKLANLEKVAKARKALSNPYNLPTLDEVSAVFGGLNSCGRFRLSQDWSDYVFDADNPRYEVLTQEYIAALGMYLADRVKAYGGSATHPVRILETGAGDGRLSYFLRFFLMATLPNAVSIIATDKVKPVNSNFPVEVMDYMDAVQTYKPTIVINSWMPLGQDWTREYVKTPSIQEIILIGDGDACGTPVSWRPESNFSGKHLDDLEDVQVNRTQSPSTVSLRRANT